MKKHLLNRCKNCGHAWFPQGFDFSRKCPSCGSVDVDVTGRFYLGMLVVITIGAGILWATDRPHKAPKNVAAAATPLVHMKPRLPATPAPLLAVPPPIATEAEGRREALRLYPDLGVANTPLNREFVARYRSYQRLDPDFFQNPAWPLILAKECAGVLGEQGTTQ